MQAFLICMPDKLQFRPTNLLVSKCIFNSYLFWVNAKVPFQKYSLYPVDMPHSAS